MKRILSRQGIGLSLLALAAVGLGLAWVAPSDVTLASTSKVVYLHGASIWTGMLALTVAGGAGLAAVALARKPGGAIANAWAIAIGRTGLLFWAASVAVSVLASQMAWNGVFMAEPRYQTVFRVLAIGSIVQVIVILFNRPALSGALHAAQAAAMWALLLTTPSVLHPDNPIMKSTPSIQFFFGLIVLACGLAAIQVARLISGVHPLPRG